MSKLHKSKPFELILEIFPSLENREKQRTHARFFFPQLLEFNFVVGDRGACLQYRAVFSPFSFPLFRRHVESSSPNIFP